MCRLGRFHALLRSETEFRQHLPAVLQIHVSATSRENVHPENNGEALSKLYLGSKQSMENEPNLHILGLSKKRGQFERVTVVNMQRVAYL